MTNIPYTSGPTRTGLATHGHLHRGASPPGSAPGVPHEKCFPRRAHMGTGTASEGSIRPVRAIPARERRLGVRDSAAPGLRAEEPSVYGNRRPVIFPLLFLLFLLCYSRPLSITTLDITTLINSSEFWSEIIRKRNAENSTVVNVDSNFVFI
jgi:hypothetical protein